MTVITVLAEDGTADDDVDGDEAIESEEIEAEDEGTF